MRHHQLPWSYAWMQSDWICGHRTRIFGRTWSQSTWPRWSMMKLGLYIFIGLFFNNPEVLDIMATLSNLAVRAAAFATTYPECLHWKYRQRWVGDMVIYGSLLLQISLIKVFFGPCAVGFGSTKSHKNQVIMSYRQHDWNQDTYLPGWIRVFIIWGHSKR